MTYAIVVSSETGNTRLVADALLKELDGNDMVYFGGVPEDISAIEGADTVLAGFWTDKGTCDEKLAGFLGALDGKRVFLFGTAGFGGSEAYFEQVAGRVATCLGEGNELLGWAMCQGRIRDAVRERFERTLEQNPDDARTKAMLANFDAALGHPNEQDVERIVAAAREALAR